MTATPTIHEGYEYFETDVTATFEGEPGAVIRVWRSKARTAAKALGLPVEGDETHG